MRVLVITVLVLLVVAMSFVLGVYVGAQTVGDPREQNGGQRSAGTSSETRMVEDPARAGADESGASDGRTAAPQGGADGATEAEPGDATAPGSAAGSTSSERSETRPAGGSDGTDNRDTLMEGKSSKGGEEIALPARVVGILEAFRGRAGDSAGGAVAGAGMSDGDSEFDSGDGLKSMSRAYVVQTRTALSRSQGAVVARDFRRISESVTLVAAHDNQVFVRVAGFRSRPSARAAVRELTRTTSVPLDVVRVIGAPLEASDNPSARAGAGG